MGKFSQIRPSLDIKFNLLLSGLGNLGELFTPKMSFRLLESMMRPKQRYHFKAIIGLQTMDLKNALIFCLLIQIAFLRIDGRDSNG